MRLVRVIKDGETEVKLVEFTSIKAGYTFFVKGCPVVCGEDAHISEDADYDGALLYDQEGEGYFPEDLDALEHPKVGFQSLQRLLCGERCEVATHGGLMRFLVTGSYVGMSEQEMNKARQNHMALTFFQMAAGTSVTRRLYLGMLQTMCLRSFVREFCAIWKRLLWRALQTIVVAALPLAVGTLDTQTILWMR